MNKLDYKQKCYAITGAFLLFLIVGYNFSFADTFTLKREIKTKESTLLWLKAKEKELPLLKRKMLEFEKAYSKKDSTAVREKLTACISGFAEKNQCLVTEIPSVTSFRNDKLKVKTNTFTVRGTYFQLVTLINVLENEYKYVSKIISARFYTLKDMKIKKKNLNLTLITRSFEQNN